MEKEKMLNSDFDYAVSVSADESDWNGEEAVSTNEVETYGLLKMNGVIYEQDRDEE